MFFFFAKIFGYLATLPNLFEETILLGVALTFTRWFRAGRALALTGAAAMFLLTMAPGPNFLVRPLEDRFPAPRLTEAPTGVIVLGGAVDEGLLVARGQVALNSAAERMTEAVALARRFPQMRIVFSGGGAAGKATESDAARAFFAQMGVAPERLGFEDRSRDTWENAVYTRDFVQPKPGERWLLVTSAMHMPRSIGIFRKVGFPVIAYPVDYRSSGGAGDYFAVRRMGDASDDLDRAAHEWIGLVAYYLTGKTNALFPAP
ncbi:MAG: YdcF family protein [Hyphomicrobiales bacterium]|nr:YdcF family protein [Hyphomicrobiales bacterium]